MDSVLFFPMSACLGRNRMVSAHRPTMSGQGPEEIEWRPDYVRFRPEEIEWWLDIGQLSPVLVGRNRMHSALVFPMGARLGRNRIK